MSDGFQHIRNALHSFGPFSDEDVQMFYEQMKQRQIRKKELILCPGETCESLTYLLRGSMRAYWLDDDNEEHIKDLWVAESWVLDRDSFTSQSPSRLFLEAYEDSEIYELALCDLHDIIGKSPSFFSMGKIIYADPKNGSGYGEGNPEDKYRYIIERRPEHLQKFPPETNHFHAGYDS